MSQRRSDGRCGRATVPPRGSSRDERRANAQHLTARRVPTAVDTGSSTQRNKRIRRDAPSGNRHGRRWRRDAWRIPAAVDAGSSTQRDKWIRRDAVGQLCIGSAKGRRCPDDVSSPGRGHGQPLRNCRTTCDGERAVVQNQHIAYWNAMLIEFEESRSQLHAHPGEQESPARRRLRQSHDRARSVSGLEA